LPRNIYEKLTILDTTIAGRNQKTKSITLTNVHDFCVNIYPKKVCAQHRGLETTMDLDQVCQMFIDRTVFGYKIFTKLADVKLE
jgi:hypothetical protein